ncbi:hypothetical protein HAX54_045972 [Datura stramonium]|uniref:Uncharacterized protein n=1 Tax=Datura stramonium TaxID=4076 RepID=A0ABS8WKB8_DATST|nr:hypothetical protein [Datura stramonium]
MALAKAALVDDLQNKNQDLMKQIEICQEENKILDKMHRQKVAEVEKLTQTVRELEEAVLAGGAAANAVREYQRKVQELNEEKRILDRELARAKISANRVAVVVANDWKDARELQQLKDKLAIAERAAKAEVQLKQRTSGASDGCSRSEVKEKQVQLTDQKENGHSDTSREFHSNGIVCAYENGVLNAAEKMKCWQRRVETLNKAMEIGKRMRREVAAMERRVAAIRNGKEYVQRLKRSSSAREP